MLRIAVIDDDETEVEIWRILQERYFQTIIDVTVFQDIETAIEDIRANHYDLVIVDNFIPPHQTAKFALNCLKNIQFKGRVIVFSNTDIADLGSMLGHNVEAELFSKQDFMAILQMRNFVETVIIGSETMSASASA
jgi:response regulator of citrate/malate metabolism